MNENEQRRGPREALAAKVNLRKPKEMAYAVELEELSQHGCRIRLRERMRSGQLVWITVPGLEPLQSWIRWQGEWHAGVEFERPMHVAVFDHVAAQMRRAATAH